MLKVERQVDGELYPTLGVRDGEAAWAAQERAAKIALGKREVAKARSEYERRAAERKLIRLTTPQRYTTPWAGFVAELRERIPRLARR